MLSRNYPNGLKLAYEYNDYGYVEWEKNAASGYVYRQHIAQDAFGNMTQANLGNGVTEYRDYDSATGWVQSLEARIGGVAVHQLNYTNYDNFGNLLGYNNGATGVSESYIYDNLHRLESQTTSAAGVSAAVSFSYDAVGNLLSKSDYGSNYLYGNRAKSLGGNAGANAVRRVTKTDGSTVNFSYDNEGNLISGDGLSISYNSFKQPTQISRGSSTFSFTYGANLERLKEVRDGLTTYEIDKAYEQSSDGSWKVYLDEVAIVSHNSEDGHRIAYSHKDRLGSSITFTDHNGQVTGRRHYDAFGKPRAISGALMEPAHRPRQINFTDIAGISNAGITRRGFTDHRHLDEAELIHMNGRAYDYNLGRFLSVDPVIQSPGNSQSLNPYSYIMNNPLAGTDPTGYMAIDSLRDRMKEREEQSRSRPKGPPAGNNTVGGSPVYVMYFGVGGAANGADGRKKSSEASDIGSQGDSDNTMQRKNNSETYKETKGTGRDMDASETKATLDSIPDSIKYVKSFIEMLESKEGAWFDKVVERYGYDNATDCEDTRMSLIADSTKVIGRMEHFMANPDKFYYVQNPAISGEATHYMMHSRVGFGKPFFDGDSRFKAAVMIHEMSHTVFAGNDGDWNTQHASGRLQQLSQSARESNSTQAAHARRELRTNAYLYEFSVMGGL